ncbi:MAG: tRNA (adenosine(37)-N6)-threonylcarbamoyltransferase complex dimerization subunit type 1 TsaB [Bacteroidota bacterium]
METLQPYFLVLETATMVGSVAVYEGEKLLGALTIHQERSHAKLLVPMIQSLLGQLSIEGNNLSGIVVSKGPGSYTGLRVGVSTAKGLCMAYDVPLLSIGSLELLAWQVQELAKELDAWICPMIDARRMEVYTAVFDEHITEKLPVQPLIVEGDALMDILSERRILFIGDGAEKCRSHLKKSPNALVLGNVQANASHVGFPIYKKWQKGAFEDLVAFEPFYLKSFVATKPRKRL